MMTKQLCDIAIIAGAGLAPQKAALFCQEIQRPYLYIALKGFADPDFIPQTPHVFSVALGHVGEMLALLKAYTVQDVLFVGAIQRPSWSDFKVDAEGLRWLRTWGRRILQGDNGLLKLVAEQMESLGYRVIGLHQLVPSLVQTCPGALTLTYPTPQEYEDICQGFRVLEVLSPYDVGQAVMMHEGVVMGIEGLEGTQNLITRCAALRAPSSGGILVKGPKTDQDVRLDLPVIGLETAECLVDTQGRGIAIRAGGVMVLEPERVCALLHASGKFLYVFP